MKTRLGLLLVMLLVILVAAPSFAATYNASGDWNVFADPEQTLTLFNTWTVSADDLTVGANIIQPSDADTFNLQITSVNEMGISTIPGIDDTDLTFSGTISGSQYYLDDMSVTLPAGYFVDNSDLAALLSDVSITLGIDSFNLTSASTLVGSLSLNSATLGISEDFNFSGNKENVPIPGAIWLLGSGVVAMFGLKRRTLA
jgi:hypothetical protein